ncbi:hypothetical protein BgiMline_018970 [Biomphalaria glabrata]
MNFHSGEFYAVVPKTPREYQMGQQAELKYGTIALTARNANHSAAQLTIRGLSNLEIEKVITRPCFLVCVCVFVRGGRWRGLGRGLGDRVELKRGVVLTANSC